MPRKTRKQSRRSRRRTLRRHHKGKKRGGGSGASTSQSLPIPSSAFGAKIGAPVNSTDSWYGIA